MAQREKLVVPGERKRIPTKEEFLKKVMKQAEAHVRFDLEPVNRWDRQVLRANLRKFLAPYTYGDGKLFGDGKPFEAHFNIEEVIDKLCGEVQKITVNDTTAILEKAKSEGPIVEEEPKKASKPWGAKKKEVIEEGDGKEAA